jgi:hypothetical protein
MSDYEFEKVVTKGCVNCFSRTVEQLSVEKILIIIKVDSKNDFYHDSSNSSSSVFELQFVSKGGWVIEFWTKYSESWITIAGIKEFSKIPH